MKKNLELTKAEIKAVKQSIGHWKRDIQKKLLKGIKIKKLGDNLLFWDDMKEQLRCGSTSCALCKLANSYCNICPYSKKYGYSCTMERGHFKKFVNAPTLSTCNAMIRALEKILE